MVIFAFVALALLLHGVAIALSFRYVQRENKLALTALTRKIRLERVTAKADREAMNAKIADLQDAFKQAVALMTPDKAKAITLGSSIRDRMEDRYVADAIKSKQVVVDGIPFINKGT